MHGEIMLCEMLGWLLLVCHLDENLEYLEKNEAILPELAYINNWGG